MKVYLDLVLLLNFAMNYSLLRAAALLTGARMKTWRVTMGAALGAAYGGLCLVRGFGFLGGNLWRAVVLGLMAACAFGLNRNLLRQAGILLLLSFALGGAAMALQLRSLPGLLALGLGLMAACRLLLRGGLRHAGQLVPATVTLGGEHLELAALRDSGNTLRDPFTGQPVLLVQGRSAGAILGGLDLRDPAGALAELHRTRPELVARLIPYRAIGGPGLLLALRCDRVTVAGREQGRFVAFTPERFSGADEYQALTGGGLYVS